MVHAGEYSEHRSHTAGQIGLRANFRVADDSPGTHHPFPRIGASRQLDLYPPSGWRIIQDFAAAASSIPK
jgi:hypothetical protein